ncbi:histidine triad nucleotide-binding protein [Kistimonas asteriae]|uniref:histidine triad nucleotide-binding protein n=1 Tax=Kistimonas asteriae TaxID=517724 RepID=UPI001BACD218|nr:histidine triad nucleotide-binding protein [Kistimonas asteriae]
MSTDCLFCRIIAGDTPAEKVYEDGDVIAFRDIFPAAPTHCLIIPRKHISTLNDANDSDTQVLGKLMLTASRLAKEAGIDESGYRVVMNCNRGAGQSVFHIHLHLLGGRQMKWPPG